MKASHTTQLILPSGQMIELIYVADDETGSLSAVPAGEVTSRTGAPTLHCCDACGSDLVYPVWWEEVDDDTWALERRCPSCEWRSVDEFGQEAVDAFDDVLTDGTEALLRALRETARTNMADDVDRLVAAIHDGHLLPMDF